MKYKMSRYNFSFRSKEGKYYLYNSQKNALIQLDEYLFNLIEDAKNSEDVIKEIPSDILKKMIDHKFITTKSEEDDYYLSLRMEYYMESFSVDKLILVIAPTTGCNFNCPYCFEDNKIFYKMSNETIDNLIIFIKKFKKSDRLYLTWYGGEPLLAIDVIEKILDRLSSETQIEICHHFLITNGSLISRKAIDLFRKYKLNAIQITLDGDEKRHNRMRAFNNSEKGSYNVILRNIDILLSNFDETKISIRVNLDRKNADDFNQIRSGLLQRWNNDQRIEVYPGILRIEDKNNKCMGCESLLHEDIRELFYSLNDKVNFYPHLRKKGCSATHVNSYLIGPRGEMYKCWNELGDYSKIIGYIHDKSFTNDGLFNKYILSSNCFESDECKECFYLPICMGGCAFYRLKNTFDEGHFDICSLYKGEGVLQKCLELHLENKKSK